MKEKKNVYLCTRVLRHLSTSQKNANAVSLSHTLAVKREKYPPFPRRSHLSSPQWESYEEDVTFGHQAITHGLYH